MVEVAWLAGGARDNQPGRQWPVMCASGTVRGLLAFDLTGGFLYSPKRQRGRRR